MNDSIGKVLQMGGEKNRKQENKSFRFSQYYSKPKERGLLVIIQRDGMFFFAFKVGKDKCGD